MIKQPSCLRIASVFAFCVLCVQAVHAEDLNVLFLGDNGHHRRCPECGGEIVYVVTYTDETHATVDHEGYECWACGTPEPTEE